MATKKTTSEEQKGFFSRLGPGPITGASDDDPSGIGTYSQAGAQLGFGIGWTMLLTYPLMAAIQEISARIGRVTGHGIAGNVCRNFPVPVMWSLVILLAIANTFNLAADVINGVLAPPVMALMMLLMRKKAVMGNLRIEGWLYWLGWLATAIMALSIAGMVFSVAPVRI